MLIPYLALVVPISAILSVVTLHVGTDLLCLVLGREKCVSTDGLNGCNWWPLSILISMGMCTLLWSMYGWYGLTGGVAGPVLSIVLASIGFRFGHRRYRKKEFQIIGERIVDHGSGQVLEPEYIITRASYECTGPASGYCLYAIILKNSDSVLATNGYVSEVGYERDRHGLIFGQRVPTLSVCFFKETKGEFKSVTLGDAWNDLVFARNSPLSLECRNWWKRFAAPQLKERDVISVNIQLLKKHITDMKRILQEAESEGRAARGKDFFGQERDYAYERVISDISGLEKLLSIAAGQLKALNHEYMSDYMELVWGKAYPTMSRIEEDLWVTAPYKEASS